MIYKNRKTDSFVNVHGQNLYISWLQNLFLSWCSHDYRPHLTLLIYIDAKIDSLRIPFMFRIYISQPSFSCNLRFIRTWMWPSIFCKFYLRLKFKYSYIPNNRKYNLILLSRFYKILEYITFLISKEKWEHSISENSFDYYRVGTFPILPPEVCRHDDTFSRVLHPPINSDKYVQLPTWLPLSRCLIAS